MSSACHRVKFIKFLADTSIRTKVIENKTDGSKIKGG